MPFYLVKSMLIGHSNFQHDRPILCSYPSLFPCTSANEPQEEADSDWSHRMWPTVSSHYKPPPRASRSDSSRVQSIRRVYNSARLHEGFSETRPYLGMGQHLPVVSYRDHASYRGCMFADPRATLGSISSQGEIMERTFSTALRQRKYWQQHEQLDSTKQIVLYQSHAPW